MYYTRVSETELNVISSVNLLNVSKKRHAFILLFLQAYVSLSVPNTEIFVVNGELFKRMMGIISVQTAMDLVRNYHMKIYAYFMLMSFNYTVSETRKIYWRHIQILMHCSLS